ncbi:MAG: type III pantothenate kinase [Fulvivirga sp.]
MILAVDIGNTNIVLGIKNKDWYTGRIQTELGKSTSYYEQKIDTWLSTIGKEKVDQVAVSSVVPALTPVVLETLKLATGKQAKLISQKVYDHLPITVENKNEIGTDLVCNSLAAFNLFKSDCVVIDFGTALTFTVILDAKIVGVNIAPGLKTALNALTSKAAQLDEIPLELPHSIIGKNTTTALQSGILWGYVGLVERMIERIEKEVGKSLKVVATGGLSHVLDPLKSKFEVVDEHLTLEGIHLMSMYFDQTNSSPK